MEKDAAPPSYPIAQVVTTTQQAAASTTQVPQATVVGVTGVSAAPTFTAVIVNTTPSGATGYYDRTPRRIICQFCGYEVITGTRPTTGLGTHLIAFGTCCVGCIPCCLIPYCVDDLKDIEHVCPNCHRLVGVKRLV